MIRIALVTPEFVTEYADGGGLGNYLHRFAKSLKAAGHEVEVFVSCQNRPGVADLDGICVHRIEVQLPIPFRRLRTLCDKLRRGIPEFRVVHTLFQARVMARAFEARHAEAPFSVIQSSDYLTPGLRIRKRPGRVHIVRCSTAADLYATVDGVNSLGAQVERMLERRLIRRADKTYAPSYFVASHLTRKYGVPITVVRPPVGLETPPSEDPPCAVPERFLFHFGQLMKRKGTFWLLDALEIAFAIEPSLIVVIAGYSNWSELSLALRKLDRYRNRLQVLYPLPKAQLYSILSRADAVVLPSLVDNLPNTAIESLMLGIPVIGTRGASIDELVTPGVHGELVLANDTRALADAIVRFWRKETSVRKGFNWQSEISTAMRPENAVRQFLRFADRQ